MKLLIELHHEHATIAQADGSEVTTDSPAYQDIADCTRSGDCEPACQYVLDAYDVHFSILKQNGGEYEWTDATDCDLQTIAESIYSDHESEFSDPDTAKLYLVWHAAHDAVDNINTEEETL